MQNLYKSSLKALFLVTLFILISCKNDGVDKNSTIHVTGSIYKPYIYDRFVQAPLLTTWVNGKVNTLSGDTTLSVANSIYVSGNDVYIAGTETTGLANINNGYIRAAKYWKNGTAINLDGSPYYSEAKSIYVSGNDVYVAGYKDIENAPNGIYWKNGVEVALPFYNATSIFVTK
ncbi:hypothetical protein [Xanthocytophaga agilis]|uniref:Uncharacterized protein n=1 Tax=Xanthocytophaga agilis TaxID=3048010 RepID=A0AAE3QZT2_9BACT|nr:hypothetical protein [Xanthocytophaga agilis]MDJ1500510.1 hypothetical protein [Xanthocytophaga agilis]